MYLILINLGCIYLILTQPSTFLSVQIYEIQYGGQAMEYSRVSFESFPRQIIYQTFYQNKVISNPFFPSTCE